MAADPAADLPIQVTKDGQGRVARGSCQGVEFVLHGDHKREVRQRMERLLAALLEVLRSPPDQGIKQLAAACGCSLPEFEVERGPEGQRTARYDYAGLAIRATDASKKGAKQKLRAAVVAAYRAGAVVCGAPPTAGNSAPQDAAGPPTAALLPTGAPNDWGRARLGTEGRTAKFLALMGAAKHSEDGSKAGPRAPEDPEATTGCEQENPPRKARKRLREQDASEPMESAPAADSEVNTEQTPALHQKMAGWFVPPTLRPHLPLGLPPASCRTKYFVVLPGQEAPKAQPTAIDAATSEHITQELQKGFHKAMQIKRLGVAGLGFQHYTHEQFANNESKGTKVVFD